MTSAHSTAKKRFLTIIVLFPFKIRCRSETLLLPSEMAGYPSRIPFHRGGPGGLRPCGAGRVKNKNAMQVIKALHSVRGKRSSCKHKGHNDKTRPLREWTECRIISPCGVAVRPLCRWDQHLCRSVGAGTPADRRIFVFQVDYNRVPPAMQDFSSAGARMAGRIITTGRAVVCTGSLRA